MAKLSKLGIHYTLEQVSEEQDVVETLLSKLELFRDVKVHDSKSFLIMTHDVHNKRPFIRVNVLLRPPFPVPPWPCLTSEKSLPRLMGPHKDLSPLSSNYWFEQGFDMPNLKFFFFFLSFVHFCFTYWIVSFSIKQVKQAFLTELCKSHTYHKHFVFHPISPDFISYSSQSFTVFNSFH